MARVIAGTARGRILVTPEGMGTRPTTDRLKEALFGSIQFDIDGSRFLDLFAGSGQIGIEALSRGAVSLDLVEQDRRAMDCIRRNLRTLGFSGKSRTFLMSVEKALVHLSQEGRQYDLIFMDPPYERGYEDRIGGMIGELGLLSDTGTLIIESASETVVSISSLSKVREKVYKTTRFTFFKKAGDIEACE